MDFTKKNSYYRKLYYSISILLFLFILLFFIGKAFGFMEENNISNWISDNSLTSTYAYAFLIIFFLVIDLFLPIPSSFVMILSGKLLGFALGGLIAFLGAIISAVLGYTICRIGGHKMYYKLIGARDSHKIVEWFEKYGFLAIIISRPIPMLTEILSCLAGLSKIPSYIRVANDEQMLEMALIENIHRENLNSVEIAISYQRLIEECSLTHEKLSERVGKKRTTITNYLRLLKLPVDIQLALREHKISMGHARALVGIEHAQKQINLLNRIIQNDLSVRQVEELVRKLNQPVQKKDENDIFEIPEKYTNIQENLSGKFNAKVQLKLNNKGKGSIVISFDNNEELEDILNKL